MTSRTTLSLSLGIAIATLVGCAPKVYIIDRATVLEQESGGEWPDVDTALRDRMVGTSPSAVKTPESSDRKNKLIRQLEPDQSTQSPSAPSGR